MHGRPQLRRSARRLHGHRQLRDVRRHAALRREYLHARPALTGASVGAISP
jgi:hypothetical protein